MEQGYTKRIMAWEDPATGRSGPDLPGHSEDVTPDLETLGNS